MANKDVKTKDMEPRKDTKGGGGGGNKPNIVGPLPPTTGGGFQIHDEKDSLPPPLDGAGPQK